MTTPSGATVERTEAVLDAVQKSAASIDEVESVSTLSGYSLLTESDGASYGMGMINLKHWDERERSVDDVIALMKEKTKNIYDATIEFFPPPAVPGFGNTSGFELRLLDKTGSGDFQQTARVTNEFIENLRANPAITNALHGV